MKRLFLFLTLLFLSTSITVYGNDNVVKVLAIGNSFSEDATETYLDDLARAGQVKMIIGNAMIGGCSLERHWNNALLDLPDYSYRKIDVQGEKKVEPKKTLLDMINDEDWDYITIQQASHFSGVYATYLPYLPNLVTYLKKHAKNPNVKIAFHMTWAYAKDSKHGGFLKFGKDQNRMFDAIVDAVQRATAKSGIDIIIPAGPAIQYARESELGDNFCRDGYHLNDFGKFTAACVWYEVLTGKPATDNPFKLSEASTEQDIIIKKSAHRAIIHTQVLQQKVRK
ncbi:DUF4886 domain-containing protein [Massilibacteroides sp.]|uniref:DUF4886 domain-containing protein n=1 Tax=Massilibacteroides sp. TaxID=2034766 RepID=UPI002632C84D|nr:DUF4886 domain-containing protein [Massilibacteroides sp.]MDD4516740.1 DUF4886 domain-containing protein [Massilibacteroides sp.]